MTTLLMLLLGSVATMAAPEAGPRPAPVVCALEVVAGLPVLRVEVTDGHQAWFVVDTGATGTTIGTGLARRLGLRAEGVAALVTVGGRQTAATVHLPALRLPGLPGGHGVEAAVHDLGAVRRAVPWAEGVLGQDVLARYDYLLDYEARQLVIGRFDPPPDGVGLALAWSAGRPVLLVDGRAARHGLVLDSGADVLVMEAAASRDALRAPPARRRGATLDTHGGAQAVEVESHPALTLAAVRLTDVDLVRLPSHAWRMAPEVGLLPASYFARVYVSARTGRAVVWER